MRVSRLGGQWLYSLPLFPSLFSNAPLIFPISLLTRVLFSQFRATYFSRIMYINCQIPHFHLACFSSSFEICIVPFLRVRIFISSLLGQHSCHIIILVYSSLYNSRTRQRTGNICSLYPFWLSPSFFLFSGFPFPWGVNTFFSQFSPLSEARHAGAIFEMGVGAC